jgi:hypothetical protein
MARIPKNTKVQTFIYTLEDPDTNEIRYVGKTVKCLKHRLTNHIYSIKKEKNHRTNWIKSIIKKGKKPIIKMIDSCSWEKSQDLETYWITKLKNKGANLVNLTNGGEGNLGLKLDKERKEKLLLAISKKIYQYDLQGVFIKEFSNAVEAAKSLNLIHSSKINAAARGDRGKAANFLWSYEKHDFLVKYKNRYEKAREKSS